MAKNSKSISDSIARNFDATVEGYDSARAKLVPCFETFYATAIRLLPFREDEHICVLDLGAGTGLLSARIRKSFPRPRLRLMDLSAEMLERARQRLCIDDTQVEIVLSDYTREPLGGPYDAVVSALTIHHCEDDTKRTLMRRIYQALRPFGVFVNADQVAAPTASLSQQYDRWWIEEVRQAGASDEEVGDARRRMADDRCSPLQAQLEWLGEAGFQDVDCWFKDGMFAVYSGRRP